VDYEWLLIQIFRITFDNVFIEEISLNESYEETIREKLIKLISYHYSILSESDKKEFREALLRLEESDRFNEFDEFEKDIILQIIAEEVMGDGVFMKS